MITSLNIILLFLIINLIFKILLDVLNIKEAKKNANKIPTLWEKSFKQDTYKKSINYTCDKSIFSIFSEIYAFLILTIWLILGGFTQFNVIFNHLFQTFIPEMFHQGLFVFTFFIVYSLCFLPLSIYKTFSLETKYNFNQTTILLFVKDLLKSFGISLILLLPATIILFYLIDLLLKYSFWWIWISLIVIFFQLLMQMIFPKFILPLFNKMSPLKDEELKKEIFNLSKQVNFQTKDIKVMDGSKRSKHSNAFFTGFGKSKMIVFFDTLLEQLNTEEIKAVFAHEVGHFKQKHILKNMLMSMCFVFIFFYLVKIFYIISFFSKTFELNQFNISHIFILLVLLNGLISFWTTPLFNKFSRKYEYEADAFAKKYVNAQSLVNALVKLSKENLGNLTPHSLYSFFYYSHPTLLERQKALLK